MTRKSYIILNITFIALISGIFTYCYFINAIGDHVICVHQRYLGIDCPSCGLTRSFSALLHQNYSSAIEWNKYGLQLFLFFAAQFGLRAIFLLLAVFRKSKLNIVLKVDWIMSAVLFLVCFLPFIIATFYLFYKILLSGNISI